MRVFTFLTLLLFSISVNAQNLPLDFEGDLTTEDFTDFDGGVGTVISNPQMNDDNPSATVGQIVRDGGAVFAGSKIILDDNLNWSETNGISMQIYSIAPVGTTVKFKLEGGGGATERDRQTTVSGAWETLTWDFSGTPATFNEVVFMFDFGNVGDGSAASTFLFDNVQQFDAGAQIDYPVTFEDTNVNYTLTDFEGNSSQLVADPENPDNTVARAFKTEDASPSAGTTIGTPAGFATDIPLTLNDSKMYVRVWSPAADIPVRLKVENRNDPTQTCETEVNTTTAGWQDMEFDFTNEAPGTAALEFGLNNGWTYGKASIFFNFGVGGAQDEGQFYYFDNVNFGSPISGTKFLAATEFSVFPNPTAGNWVIAHADYLLQEVRIFDATGKLISVQQVNDYTAQVNATALAAGIYFAQIKTESGRAWLKLIKK